MLAAAIITLALFIVLYFLFFSGLKKVSISVPGEAADNPLSINDKKEEEISADQKQDNTEDEGKNNVNDIKEENIQSDDEEDKKINDDAGGKMKIIDKFVSWGYESSGNRKIDAIIIHSSYDALGSEPYNLNGLLDEYKQYGVSPHYLIGRKGDIYRLVSEKNIAYHAGESRTPDGRTGVNNFSIGIEMMNKEDGKFTDDQYDSLNDLLRYLRSKYKIKYVLGHNQIAPGRKSDPWNFDWGMAK